MALPHIAHWYPDLTSGGAVARSVLGLAAAQQRAGCQVTLVAAAVHTPPLYDPVRIPAGVRLHLWRPSGWVSLRSTALYYLPRTERACLRALDADIVHVHGEFNPNHLWVPRAFRCPVILSPHGGFHPVVLNKSLRAAKQAYIRVARAVLYNQVRAFHALCPAEEAHIAARFPGQWTYCAPQGPGFSLPATLPPPGTSFPAFLFVGRLDVYTKGLDILLRSFRRCLELHPQGDFRLTLAGPDWNGGRLRLQRQAQALDVSGRLSFRGPLTAPALTQLLAEGPVFVQTSRHEGFTLSAIEALLAGCPAVLSKAAGTASFAEIAALPQVRVVPPQEEEVARAMLDAAGRYQELRRAAIESRPALNAFFSWDRAAALHLAGYERILCSSQS